MKKYEILKDDHIEEYGSRKLCRIRALRDFGDVKKGDLGGYIQDEKNLSHDGNCWIYNNAQVHGNARVHGNAWVCSNAEINHRMVVNSKFYDLKFFAFTNARGITALKVNGQWLFNIGCQNLITKDEFIERIHNTGGGLKRNPHRQKYLDILKLF